jgi:hypothetical protein
MRIDCTFKVRFAVAVAELEPAWLDEVVAPGVVADSGFQRLVDEPAPDGDVVDEVVELDSNRLVTSTCPTCCCSSAVLT